MSYSNNLRILSYFYYIYILYFLLSVSIFADNSSLPILPKDGKNKDIVLIWLYPEADFDNGIKDNEFNTKKKMYENIVIKKMYEKMYLEAGYIFKLKDLVHDVTPFPNAPAQYPNYKRKGSIDKFLNTIKGSDFNNAAVRTLLTHMMWGIVQFDKNNNKYFVRSATPQSE